VDGWFDSRTYPTNIATGDNTRSADKSGTDVGYYGPVQIWHDHDVELAGPRNKLHGSTIFFFDASLIYLEIKDIRVIDYHIVVLNTR
jgi:hypothetical protein